MIVSFVAAVGTKGELGKDGKLLWHIPSELKHFFRITKGGTVLMGRKTFESIGRPLPKRRNIVLTRQKDWSHEGVEVVSSVEEALNLGVDELFVAGGAEIYSAFIPYAHRFYKTIVNFSGEADTYFPEFDTSHWITRIAQTHEEDNELKWTFRLLELENLQA